MESCGFCKVNELELVGNCECDYCWAIEKKKERDCLTNVLGLELELVKTLFNIIIIIGQLGNLGLAKPLPTIMHIMSAFRCATLGLCLNSTFLVNESIAL